MKSHYVQVFIGLGLALSLIGNVVLLYLWIDRSISVGYANDSLAANMTVVKRLDSLLLNEWHGLKKDEVMKKLELEAHRHPEEKILIKKYDGEENVVWIDDIPFYFRADKLEKIGIDYSESQSKNEN